MSEKMKYTVLFGGTFNPVHCGHIQVALEILRYECVDEILFVPAGTPPWKAADNNLASADDRWQMVALALDGCPGMGLTDLELVRDGYSYTLDTVRVLRDAWPQKNFCFLLGMDAMAGIRFWYGFEELLSLIPFWVMTRPDTPPGILEQVLPEYTVSGDRFFCSGRAEVRRVSVSPLMVSATMIRERIGKGQAVTGLVPEAVADYIRDRGLYIHV
ncbi:nicotinate-nucleotide adenylyltransferase [Desulfobotulus sp. H1]|uniref:Probable nicotinate-nucleotide adenylyltransferase n=1 Tax=Desulfobotulus pelophilus TaxID=2823377 RepID=A0ABT3NCE8_9BACT|nr:nicotinate-nucleotide adenylyltransferase [Desulfobotulus pelophilus]MCW7755153.1 nicotinate-nucleotide adenylyltransferase [Desulfobotulus pelophilus]